VTFSKKQNLLLGAMVGDGHRWAALLRLFFCVLFLLNSGCVATGDERDDAAKMPEQTFTVKGKIQKVSGEEGIIVVTSPKGDRIFLQFTSQTPVVGGAMKDVDRFHPIKAVYTVEAGQNRLLSLELLPQGSCSGK